MIGVVRVVTLEDPNLLAEHGNVISRRYGLETVSRSIPDQPFGIHDEATELRAIPKIVEMAEQFAEEGASAVVVSCAADPAVSELRQRLTIPVIGAGSAASLVAKGLGVRAGVLGITDDAPQVMKDTLGDLLVGYAQPQGVTNTTDLLTPEGRQHAIDAAKRLLQQGAQAIVFACTGYSTIGLADVLRSELGCLVIDAVEAEGLFTWYACKANSVQMNA